MADIQVANTDADLSGNTLVTEENAYTITGLHTFSRSTNAPFACISGAAYVQYLDSDKLDGQEGTYYLAAANFTGTLAVNQGGTGAATFTDGGILLGSGTGAITATAVLGDGVILIGDASGDPTTLDVGSSTAITILGTVATGVWNGTAVTVAYGGTGASSLTDGGVLLGSGTGAITAMSVLTDGQMIVGDGSGDPVAESGATLRTSIGVGTGDSPTFTAVTAAQVDITAEGDLRLQDNTGGEYVGLDAPSAVSGSYTLTFPAAIGSVDQVLSISNTDGTLQWATPETGDITSVVAGAGMTGGGSSGDVTLNVIGTADKITVNANDVTIASTYIGQTSITTLGTIGTGTWQGTDVGVAHGGTGASSLTDGGVLLGSGTGAVTAMAVLADSEMIVGDGSGDPVAESGATLRTSIGVGTGDSPQFTGLTISGTGVSSLDVGGGINVGTGNVSLVGTDGKISGPLSSTIIDDLSGANLTTLNASNISSGTLANARLPTNVDLGGTLDVTGATTLDSTLGVGQSSPDGTVHIETGSAGSISFQGASDDLIVENSTHGGITVATPAASEGSLMFLGPTTGDLGIIAYSQASPGFQFHVANAEKARLTPTGLGVAVNDPDVALDVSGGENKLDIFRITQRLSGAAAYGLQIGLDPSPGDPVFCRVVNDTATESFRMQRSSGLVAFSNGVSFNPGETTAANTLDDYEEGVFTPVLTGTTSASDVAYDTQSGIYTKVGDLVFVNIYLDLSSKGTIVGFLKLTGLPFTNASHASPLAVSMQQVIQGADYRGTGPVYGSSAFMYLFKQKQSAATTDSQMDSDDINDSTIMAFSGSYKV